RRRHTRLQGDWSSDVCSSDLVEGMRKTFLLAVDHEIDVALAPSRDGLRAMHSGAPKAQPTQQVFEARGIVIVGGELDEAHTLGEIGRASCRERAAAGVVGEDR